MYISQDQTGIGQPASTPSSPTMPSWLRSAAENAIVRYHLSQGVRDVDELTDRVFFFRHPGRQGRKLDRSEAGFATLAAEWKKIRDTAVRPLLAGAANQTAQSRAPSAPVKAGRSTFKYHPPTNSRTHGGYSRYGGGRVDQRLRELRTSSRLQISDSDIDLLQRISNVESNKQIQGINSYDDAYMSMGFMQWPIAFGKLQRLIESAAPAFRKHGIELDRSRMYHMRRKYDTQIHRAIKGAQNPDDLRSLDWAKRFYAAGLDPEIIVIETNLALRVIEESKQQIKNKVGGGFILFFDRSPVLRALVIETHNNRPNYLYRALERALKRISNPESSDTDLLLTILRKAIIEVYQEEEGSNGSKKAERIIARTASLNP